MNTSSLTPGHGHPAAHGRDLLRGVLNRLSAILLEFTLFGVILFASAGTIAWLNGWSFLGLSILIVMANAAYLLPRNPEVIVERGRRHTGTRTFDSVIMSVYTAFYLALLVLAGLDAQRWDWAPLGWGWAVAGGAAMCVGAIPMAGAMGANRNLETSVRIQSDRGHEVATGGPYRFVRHPMYVGMLIQLPGMALLLGSAWALVPAFGAAVCMVVRTALEDRTLRRDLPGYREYAERTRYRLVPGVW